MKTIKNIFSDEGILAASFPGFQTREAQQELALAVEHAIDEQQTLVAEASTGTGKTLAYLIPAMLSGKKTIISTGTKNLQDQLFHRDLPTIRKILALPNKVALLKGRANYLCRYRLELHLHGEVYFSKDQLHDLQIVSEWQAYTKSGDVSELTDLEDDANIMPYVTSNNENCLGQECPQFGECFFMQARREALEADVLVINHHLFFADMVLRDDGFGEVLPLSDVMIFDEAHLLADVATQFLGERVSTRQLQELAQDTDVAFWKDAKEVEELAKLLDRFKQGILNWRLALGVESKKAPWQTIAAQPELQKETQRLTQTLTALQETLGLVASRSKALENVYERSQELLQRIMLLTGKTPDNYIHWYETFKKSCSLHLTPMVIAEDFKRYCEQHKRAWIFTSATIAVANDFKHFSDELGVNVDKTMKLSSPFDYQQQALMYLPRGMPDPNSDDFLNVLLEHATQLINAAQGRTFLLFTSYYNLNRAYDSLSTQLDFPILRQGDQPKAHLLKEFTRLGNAVLLGTSSFWQGVDVRGEALSCVIIDKLPFASPGDPILQARLNNLKQQGREPFYDYQLPKAVISLKQGAGRLIRDQQDRGVLMIADPRLQTRRYGDVFFQSLPDMKITRDMTKACAFFTESLSQ